MRCIVLFVRAACLLLVFSIWGLASQASAANGVTDRKDSVLDPMALLRAYEKTLAPYQRFKATWVDRYARLEKGKEPEWIDRDDTWTLIRDGNRARSMVTHTSKKANPKGERQQGWQEEIWEKGKMEVSVHPPHPDPDMGNSNAPSVLYRPCVSEDDFLRSLRFVPASLGIIDDKWIPDFLRKSKLSAERSTFDGHPVEVLRGVSGKIEMSLWLDPAIGHIPRKITCDNRNSTLFSPTTERVYEVKRFAERNGVLTPAETLETDHWGERAAEVCVAIRVENGKQVLVQTPMKDEQGKIAMRPPCDGLTEIKLVDIQFHPTLTDEDFKISKPIPDGTKVTNTEEYAPHVTYEWQQGKVVKIVEPAIAGKFDPAVNATAAIACSCKAAKWRHENVLVLFGANGWRRCAALEEAFQSNPETLWPLLDFHHRYAYQVVLADGSNPANRALAAKYGLTLDGRESPCMTVLAPDGQVLCNQDLAAFEQGGKYRGEKLVDFLKQWEARRENAEEVLRVALERAQAGQKKVFVVFSATYCYPCRRLIDLLTRWQDFLGQDYILVKIDVDCMTHVAEAKSRIGVRDSDLQMIPWYTILSPAGEKLVTSAGPQGNIGLPSKQPGIAHFVKMIRQTSSRISPEQLKTIEVALGSIAKEK